LIGDSTKISVAVGVEPSFAFEIFTADIDRWWRRGIKFRHAGRSSSLLCIEPLVGGRLFESFDGDGTSHVVEVGQVRVWEPPNRLIFSWRNANFAAHEHTEVQVEFAPTRSGTLVTVTHSGLSALRPDHPARHGLQGSEFCRSMGLWWGEQMSSLRQFVLDRREPADS
jgi:uncharacterized protein YndB with AHSA1/START domain